MDRQELLRREQASWDSLMAAVDRVPAERRDEEDVVPGWSVKDLVWHCGFWADDGVERLAAIAASGDPVPDQPESVWQAMNDRAARESKLMSWTTVVEGAEAARRRVRVALSAMPEGEPADAEFAEDTFEHYDEHTAQIEAFASSGE